MAFLNLAGQRIDYEEIAGTRAGAPLLLLHEGLGSVSLWREFPAALAAATGRRVLTYSRAGYGRSIPRRHPFAADYMHREALEALPALRAALGLDRPVLLGHSDGASIALLHAGAGSWPVAALILEAPHVFVEAVSLESIAAAKVDYETGALKPRLARHHADVETAFYGWNDAWLAPEFRDWNIEPCLSGITVPTLLIQGADDPYGTLAQIEAIERGIAAAVAGLVLANCGHTPHREQQMAVLAAVTRFLARL